MLKPWYITGLIEGEGCFSVSFNKRKKLKIGVETRPSFSVSLSKRDLNILKELRNYFQCGGIRYSKSDRTYKYEVRSIKDIVNKVIPHFIEFPLQGRKKEDFEKFEKICKMIYSNLHMNRSYLSQIIEIAYSMNPSGKRKYKKEYLLRIVGKVKV